MRIAIHRLVRTLGAGLLGLAGPAVVSVAADDVGRRVYVSAFDEQTGALVTDLRPAEITVLEDEVMRPILDIRPANLPLKVVVLVDTSSTTAPGFDRIQEGLTGFLEDLPTGQEVSILTVAPEPRWVMQGAIDQDEIQAGLARLEPGDGTARLLDGLIMASRWVMEDRDPHRPVFVVVAGDGRDQSRDLMEQFETLIGRTRQLGITVHTVVLQNPTAGSLVRNTSVAEALGSDLESHTGGSFRTVFRGSDLTASLGAVGERIVARSRELARQYLIRYERPDDADVSPGRLRVIINRFGVRYRVTVDGRVR